MRTDNNDERRDRSRVGHGRRGRAGFAPCGPLIAADRKPRGGRSCRGGHRRQRHGIRVRYHRSEQIDALVAGIDTLDAIVLTAGLSGSMANGRRIFEVNLIGTATLLAAVEPLLRRGTVGVCLRPCRAIGFPTTPSSWRSSTIPLSDGFFDAFVGSASTPTRHQLAYSRLEARRAPDCATVVPALGRAGRASFRCRRGSTTPR